jgi:hypothetical protein
MNVVVGRSDCCTVGMLYIAVKFKYHLLRDRLTVIMHMSLDSSKIKFLRIYQMGLKLRHLYTYEFSQHDKLLLMVLAIGCGKLGRRWKT